MVFYHNTFVISQLPDIGSCTCCRCKNSIIYYLKKFYNSDKNYKYMYIDYKGNKYLIDNNIIFFNDEKYINQPSL